MSRKKKPMYYQCHLCSWITTELQHELSVIPNYCPRCKKDSVMLTPRTLRECIRTQRRIIESNTVSLLT